jgi:integrase
MWNREVENARALWRHALKSRFDIGEMPDWRSLRLKDPRRSPRELSHEEEQNPFAQLRPDIQDAVDFLLKAGWRRNEVLGLRWSDCKLEQRQAVTKIKGGDVATRPLTDTMTGIIQRQPKVCAFVFTYVCQSSRDKRRKGERYAPGGSVARMRCR